MLQNFLRVRGGPGMIKTILAGVLVFLVIATAGDKPTLKQLNDQHPWFEHRDAIQDHDAPPLY